MRLSRYLFWSTLLFGIIRDFLPSVSNFDVYAFIAVGMLMSLVAYVLFDMPHREETK